MRFIPKVDMITMASMVDMVMLLKMITTEIKPVRLFFAAGYISNGINGSQGPNTKTVNKIQGVRLFLSAVS